jgi:hydrogenase 3 maturation protease
MGDDAAGMLVVQNLKASLPADSFLIPIEGGPAPENCTGLIRRHNPGMVIFIDAGEMGAQAGEIAFVVCNQSDGISAFGHALPLRVLGQYLETDMGCKSYLLVIQPERIDFDVPVSDAVLTAVDEVTRALIMVKMDSSWMKNQK